MNVSKETIPRAAQQYRLPELLSDIRLLDLLELSGTTVRASQLLNLSQPTVSRRYRSLAHDFGLVRDTRSLKRCRFGSNTAMRLLRLGSRAHRLAAGVARIGTDVLHHHLLAGCDWLLPTPVRFRTMEAGAELVRQGVLDGALVSGLELNVNPALDVTGLRLLELGSLHLELAVGPQQQPAARSADDLPLTDVLVAHRGLAPGLHRALLNRGLKLRTVGNSCCAPEQWLARLQAGSMAMPIDPAACAAGQWAELLTPVPLAVELRSALWLLLPKTEGLAPVITRTVEHLQQRSSGD
jgi:DNA-binding transcriptional LysR family regulator